MENRFRVQAPERYDDEKIGIVWSLEFEVESREFIWQLIYEKNPRVFTGLYKWSG